MGWSQGETTVDAKMCTHSGRSRPSDRGGGGSHPDPEIREGGSLRKIRGELDPLHPSPTDLPLTQMCTWYI